jgi:hypothetical protein
MARTKQNPEFEIYVDGEPFVWWLQRQPEWSKIVSKRRGMAIGVRHRDGQREAVLEFPPAGQPRYGGPQFQVGQVPVELIATAIASGIAAGWEPHSRGKIVNIAVDEEGG